MIARTAANAEAIVDGRAVESLDRRTRAFAVVSGACSRRRAGRKVSPDARNGRQENQRLASAGLPPSFEVDWSSESAVWVALSFQTTLSFTA